MKPAVFHDRSQETPEAKARWFQSLTMEERMQVFCDFMDLILEANPSVADKKNAQPPKKGVQIIRRP